MLTSLHMAYDFFLRTLPLRCYGRGFRAVFFREGGCADTATKFHVDFGPPAIPRGAACTALLPLHPRHFPEDQGNLEPGPKWKLLM